jgi:hypothetical protein
MIFIADFFANQILGGGELNNEELITILIADGHEVVKKNSHLITTEFIKKNRDGKFIVANFIGLTEACKQALYDKDYIIYEHDHKYLAMRDPAIYENFKAPPEHIINYDFYKKAKSVLCQSTFHKEIVEKNLSLDNINSLGGNLWDIGSLQKMREMSLVDKKETCSIMDSSVAHKNTADAVKYCRFKKLKYELIRDTNYYSFLERLGANNKFIFFPKTPETLSRVAVEARMMNMRVVTNNLVGATHEGWFRLKGEPLIDLMHLKRKEIPQKVIEIFDEDITNP